MKYRIVITGDSILAGWNASSGLTVVSTRLMVHRPDINVQNYSAPGMMMWNGPFIKHKLGVSASCVGFYTGFASFNYLVIGFGINDWQQGAPLGAFQTDYATFLDTMKAKLGTKIACLSPLWGSQEGDGNQNGNTQDEFRDIIKALAMGKDLQYWHGLDAIPNDLAHFPDGVHPNDLGHNDLAMFMRDKLATLLPA